MKYHTWQHIATVAFPFIKATERPQKSLENKTLLPWHQQKTFQSFFLFTLRHSTKSIAQFFFHIFQTSQDHEENWHKTTYDGLGERLHEMTKKFWREQSQLHQFWVTRPWEKELLYCVTHLSLVGTALLQIGHPVAYTSCALTNAKTWYMQIETELIAIVSVCKHYEPYVYNSDNIQV